MSEVLASLKKIGGSEQYTETSLWTNPSPTASYAGGVNVTLSDSISKYKYLMMRYRVSTSDATEFETIVSTSDFRKSLAAQNSPQWAFQARVSTNYYDNRFVVYVDDTTVLIRPAYHINASGTDNTAAIPLEILGINELAHQTVIGNYDVLPFQNLAANVIPSFTTKGKAKAIWMMYVTTTGNRGLTLTNVNPYTGAIDNNDTYAIDSNNIGGYVTRAQNFVVTDNSVSLDSTLSSNALKVALAYTYE